ncbi:uncharacterized protein LOC130817298 isoform X2 [Amaranthus tricolor]|uniref:uncharacterized protein LOC130817298 isoform X2 n=1 Tax=Amaranthus tricolor TaxID=29722 RepID=UPI0025912411|nr:uncharacterized protein LOC130817298 isoform X2 [Amaranthus tricolor]
MATSAFKSTSRRPTTSSSTPTTNKQPKKQQNSTQKAPLRRSRSVSAFSRTHLDTTTEFHNKRDNPLFWADGSSHFEEDNDGLVKFSKFEISKSSGSNNFKGSNVGCGETRRGRSVSRSVGVNGGERTDFGRSLSRINPTRRRRSPSCGHYKNSEENDLLNFRSKSKISSNGNQTFLEGKKKLVRSASDLSEILKDSKTWSSQHPTFETSDDAAVNPSGSQISHWGDARSTSFISKAEERIIKPVSEERLYSLKDNIGTTNGILETVRSEVRQAISDMQNDLKIAMLRGSSDVTHPSIVSDLSPELEDTNTVELVRDFREEFARELEQCEERTRILRAELAVEEHREFELNKILSDIVPEPKTPITEKPRVVRKASFERKKMSKCLEQEALAYFDECVSISTFEDSDFSSPEDLPSNMVSIDGLSHERLGSRFSGVPSRAIDSYSIETQGELQTTTVADRKESPNVSASSSSRNNSSQPNSLAPTSFDSNSLKEDIKNYVNKLTKDKGRERKDYGDVNTINQNARDYTRADPLEKVLMDRVKFRHSIEFGSMLLCGGGSVGLSLPPFLW